MTRGAFWEVLGEHTPADHVLSVAEVQGLIDAGRTYRPEFYLPDGELPGERAYYRLVELAADHVDRCRRWLGADAEGTARAEAYLDRMVELSGVCGVGGCAA